MVSAVTDFDDINHRVESATATFQKGIYHLFMIHRGIDIDLYSQIIRAYQCLFQICLSQLLLDSNYSLNKCVSRLPGRLRKLCKTPDRPTRNDLDPASFITHSVFENREWNGFPNKHPMFQVSERTLEAYARVVDARHNVIYRPFLLNSLSWEDCSLINLISDLPSYKNIRQIYDEFVSSVWTLREIEYESRAAKYFIQTIFLPYSDRNHKRPKETLLLSYARLLNPGNEQLLDEMRVYRNKLLRLGHDKRYSEITFLREWQIGEL